MSEKRYKQPWSLRRKLLIGILILIVLALALGLGLGLTLGPNNNDNDGGDNQPPTSTSTPLPQPNNTLPWTPKVADTWQIILSHPPSLSQTLTPNATVFDIDLFDTPMSTIQALQQQGKKVLCYFSAGSYEDWRPDASDFKKEDLGKGLQGWAGEKWIKLSSDNVRSVIRKRIEMAKSKGCDGVDPDNVDGYGNDNGLGLTQQDSISYISFLSSVTRPLNMTLGLKNAGAIVTAVLPVVDFSVNEQCAQYNECATFQPFIAAGKPVFHIEYPAGDGDLQSSVLASGFSGDTKKKFCGMGSDDGKLEAMQGFSTVLKKMSLDGWVEYCDGGVQVTSVDGGTGGHNRRRTR